jgi:hypothetical protein
VSERELAEGTSKAATSRKERGKRLMRCALHSERCRESDRDSEISLAGKRGRDTRDSLN